MVDKLTYYERWIVAFADILFQKQILTPEELARKMDEVAARHAKPTETCRTTAGRIGRGGARPVSGASVTRKAGRKKRAVD